MSLKTQRLSLVPCNPNHILALIEDPSRFEQAAGFPAANGLREMYSSGDVSPDWLAALRTSDGPDPWQHGFFLVHRESGEAIGAAGFKGRPDNDGMVEIAYGVAPGYQGQGYATEAARALVTFAFDSGLVKLIRAHTLPSANASTRVLAKCGFRYVGEVVDPADGLVWRWEQS